MTERLPRLQAARAFLAREAFRPVDGASAGAFRVLFGLALCLGIVRFVASGWVEVLFLRPRFFFHYPGFEWVARPPEPVLYVLYASLALLALAVATGWRLRATALAFTAGFAYVELIDVTNYLNHYYLVVLFGLLLAALPMKDAFTRPIPAWVLWLLRFQVAVVYVHAGLAKAGSDWLLHAQPLGIWLAARTETPVIGPWLDQAWVAYAMSWAGFLFDTTIVLFLSWRRTRALAFAAVLSFHFLTGVFFEIGLFPVLMPIAATLFFEPGWPRRFFARLRDSAPALSGIRLPPPRARFALAVAALLWCSFHAFFPLRHLAYPGDVLWNEEGMRWSWKVMVREKSGSITYHVRDPRSGRSWQVSPHDHLDWRQANEMSGQPDLIAQLARHIAADFRRRGLGEVEVRAEAWVSLNGRAAHPMIDSSVDLARAPAGLAPKAWILPAPEGPPLPAGGRRGTALARELVP